uniref:TM2 domain-containing protein n=1 Tax=Dictyoglomus thermophilum TaxID=14 RepID=A0A7V4DWT3_DICTH
MDEILWYKQRLTEKQLAILNSEMEKHKRSVGLAYVLFIFFGGLGVHKFYLGKTVWGVIYLILTILNLILILGSGLYDLNSLFLNNTDSTGENLFLIVGLFVMILGAFLLYDLFTLPRQTRRINEEKEKEIIQRLLAEENKEIWS